MFQRTANFSMPAHNRPLDPDARAAIKASYRERRRLARESLSGVPGSHPDVLPQRSALEVAPEDRVQAYERGWAAGRHRRHHARVQRHDHERRGERHGRRLRARQDPRDRAGPSHRRRAVSDDAPDRHQAHLRRHRLLRRRTTAPTSRSSTCASDADRAAHPARDRDRERRLRARRDRVRDRLRRDDRSAARHRHPRARGPLAARTSGRTGRGPISASRPPASPTCSSSRARAAPRCSATWCCRSSSTSTGSRTASATCASAASTTIEATPDAEDGWVAHVNEVAEATLFPQARSWYIGANIPGKPRVFMPYLGGVGNYRAHCDGVAAGGYAGFAVR